MSDLASDVADVAMSDSVDSDSSNRSVLETEDSGFKPINSQDEFDAALKSRLERAQRSTEKKFKQQIDDLTSQIKVFEESKLSIDEKKDRRLTELEASFNEVSDRYAKLERTRLVETLARDMGLPEKFWSRVQGNTDDEIISDINEMLDGLPKVDRQPLSQSPRINVSPTNSEPEVTDSAKSIVDGLNSMFNF